MVNNNKVVQGFVFDTEEDYELARKDAEMFDILWDNIRNSDGKVAIEIYESLLVGDMVKTVVGMYNIKMLQNYLIKYGYIDEKDVKPIIGFVGKKISTSEAMKSYEYSYRMKSMMNQKITQKLEKYKSTVSVLKVAVVILCVVIAIMFAVQTNGSGSNYASAKEAVIDEYASWEEELNDREEEVKKKEEAIKEESVNTEEID